MVKPLNEFGGWLRFFYIGLWISLVASILEVVLYLFLLFKAADFVHLIEASFLFLRAIFVAFLFSWLIRTVKKKDLVTPDETLGLMAWYFWVSLGVFLFVVILEYFPLAVDPLKIVLSYGRVILSLLVWYGIWSTYLKKSKRALAYYGKNAD